MTELNKKSREELEEYIIELENALGKTISNHGSTMGNIIRRSSDLSWFDPSVQHHSATRILIVDDDPGMRILARKVLSDQPFELLEASSGQQALTMIDEPTRPIDVVLLDIKMPGMDGFEVIKALKENPKTEHIRIIMVSSTTLLRDKIIAFELGASDYVVKPFAKEELLARITVQAKLIEANETIRKSEERYRFLTENVNSMISVADMEGNYVYVNEAHQRILGYSKEELLGNSSAIIIHPNDWEHLAQSFAVYIEKGDLFREPITCRLVTKEGSIKWVEIHGRLTIDEHGNPEYIVGVGTDVTERKDAENAMAVKVVELQKSEMATLNIMEDLQETISSLEKVKQELNTKNEELTLASTEQASLLNSLEEQNQIISDFHLELAETLDRAVKSEDETKRKNEELIAVQNELREINLHLEEIVEKRTSEITRLLKQKEDFITQLAHDLRSPLTPLVALMPMLRDKQEDPSSIKMADMAVRNIDYMEELVNQTVQLAKLNSTDAAEFDIQSLNLANIVEELLHTQQYNFIENNINTYNNIDKKIMVAADSLRLTELFINLTTNAIKFMDGDGTITFDAEVEDNCVVVSVKDTGIGVTEEQADHIFDEFYKADQSRHDLGSAGLGLSICKRITEKHSGEIWAKSEGLGKGTTFLFSIPLSTEE